MLACEALIFKCDDIIIQLFVNGLNILILLIDFIYVIDVLLTIFILLGFIILLEGYLLVYVNSLLE
jgi:hypothetical protein